ncbi:uncharacterized protein B0I36DRAFT_363496 [Microdochium trichocladiopsis]|uniref:Uncharacterized protein n=1 Tax=Microdochium trichocladiopsis TaxID=1682393 RepID=A0A9P8Y6B2_9PEZI|nr:uncharacterized protein B0I36DRAFT_363496 [Microdochium trichocladiopsis]KAH7028882.1 hypothetical protein B0I36DRAFT_363496 [Microdochium trichocladiopsis]
MAAFALFGTYFLMTNLAVPLSTAIRSGGDKTTLTLSGLLGLRILAVINFLLLSAASTLALLPRSCTASLASGAKANLQSQHAQLSASSQPERKVYRGVFSPHNTQRHLARLLLSSALASSITYMVLLSYYILADPARHDFQDALLGYCGELTPLETAAVKKDLKLATGFWFTGDAAVGAVGILSAGLSICKLSGWPDGQLSGREPERNSVQIASSPADEEVS